jgi:hypothetical protein
MQLNNEILVDYLDNHLSDTECKEVENILQNDKSLTVDFNFLKLAIDVVRMDAIESQVSKVRSSLQTYYPLVSKLSAVDLKILE